MQSAARVGALVLIFAAMLLGAYALLRQSFFAPKRDVYYVEIEDAEGLAGGSKVTLAGVEVGVVTEVELQDSRTARAKLEIESKYRLPAGTVAVLPASFISLGDRTLTLRAPEETTTALLSPGDVIPGRKESPIDSFLPEADETIAELNRTLVAVQQLMGDQELVDGLKALMASGKQTADSFAGLANSLNQAVAANESRFTTLLDSANETASNIDNITESIMVLLDTGQPQKELLTLLDQLNTAAAEGTALVQDIRSLVKDEELNATLRETADNFKEISESGARIAADAEKMSESGVVVAENGEVISAEAAEFMRKANELATEVQDLVDGFKETLDGLRGETSSLFPDVEIDARVTRTTDPNYNRADINIRVPIGQDHAILGLYDAFETNRLNLQIQRNLGQGLDLRAGVYASKPGIGVDFRFAPRWTLRSDVFGLNDTQFDARLEYEFGSGFRTWAGVDRIFRENAFGFGIGLRR